MRNITSSNIWNRDLKDYPKTRKMYDEVHFIRDTFFEVLAAVSIAALLFII